LIRVRPISAVMSGAALLALVGLASLSGRPALVEACGQDAMADTDGDFLPDVVEWVVLTDANNPDTDGDGISDFVEVVQRGSPRHPGSVAAQDHELRVVMTGPDPGEPAGLTRLHLFFRFLGGTNLLSSFSSWLETPIYPGLQLPLNVLASTQIEFAQRSTLTEGQWVHIAVPMVSEAVLQPFLPCSIRTVATIGGNQIQTGVALLDTQGQVSSLMPFGDGRHVIQSIVPRPHVLPTSNRVCVLALEVAGSGPGGTLYEIVDADCEDCNELECGPSCQLSIGWIISIPGGTQGL